MWELLLLVEDLQYESAVFPPEKGGKGDAKRWPSIWCMFDPQRLRDVSVRGSLLSCKVTPSSKSVGDIALFLLKARH